MLPDGIQKSLIREGIPFENVLPPLNIRVIHALVNFCHEVPDFLVGKILPRSENTTQRIDESTEESSHFSQRSPIPIAGFREQSERRNISKGLLGKGAQHVVPSRNPSPAKRYENTFTKAKTVSRKIMPSEGFTHASKLLPA